jgi:hypothetical protein
MINFLKSLFGGRDRDAQGPQVANSVTVNEVLARRQGSLSAPVLRAVKAGGRRPQLLERQQDKPGVIDFGIDSISLAEPSKTGFNPYDSGGFSTTDPWENPWEKRYREDDT